MSRQFDVSVVISTYNRCDQLPGALESLLGQQTGGAGYEVIAVDNNSTDRTRQVIESFVSHGHPNLIYVFEGRQGLAHGRNSGVRRARAEIVVFTDDDVRVERDWVANIKRAFDEHPEVGCVGGKILPRWPAPPPAWLTREHWVGPLALQDYGEEPLYVNAQRLLSLAGANLSFRRKVLEQIGLFSPDFSTGGDKSDTELLMRYWLNGGQSLYDPSVLVTAEVQDERLTKAYHRRWYTVNGRFNALMNINEIIDRDGRLTDQPSDAPRLFGVPAFIYRQLIAEGVGWLAATVRRQESQSFTHENRARCLIGYLGKRYEQSAAARSHSRLAELMAFAKAIWRRKVQDASFRASKQAS